MAENFNIQTTQGQANEAGGLEQDNPAMTYVDFANQISRNALAQQQQAAQVAQAQALAKQYGVRASQSEAAQAAGVNPELKDYATVDEATAFMKAMGLDDDTIQEFTKSLGDQKYVDKSDIRAFIAKRQLANRSGQAFIATDDDVKAGKVDESGKPLIVGQSYQAFVDPNTGETQYIRAGGEALAGAASKMDLKTSEANEKQWQKLDAELNKFTCSQRGNQLIQAVPRADRAINELSEGQPLTSQVLSYIQKDISGIFQGGVPPVTGMEAEDFTNVLQRVNQIIAKYTGVQGYLHHDLGNQRQYLLGLLMRLRDSTTNIVKQQMSAEAAGYEQIINDDPDRWKRMIDQKMAGIEAGLSPNAQTTLAAMKQNPLGNLPAAMTPTAPTAGAAPTQGAPAQPNIDALAQALGLKKRGQ